MSNATQYLYDNRKLKQNSKYSKASFFTQERGHGHTILQENQFLDEAEAERTVEHIEKEGNPERSRLELGTLVEGMRPWVDTLQFINKFTTYVIISFN